MNDKPDRYFQDKEAEQTVLKYEEMIRTNRPVFFDVYEFETIIDHYLDNNHLGSAMLAIQKAIGQHPFASEILIRKARLLSDQNKVREAWDVVRQLAPIENTNQDVMLLKASLLLKNKQVDAACKYFDQALVLTYEHKDELLHTIANILEGENYMQMSIKYLLRAHGEHPENLGVIYDLAYVYDRMGQHQGSIKYYLAYLDEDPYSETTWHNLGLAYEKTKQYELAIEAYDYALALDPEYLSSLLGKSSALLQINKYDKAIESLEELLEYEPDNPTALCQIGECHEKSGNYAQAKKFYTRTIKLEPKNEDAWFGLSMVHLQTSKYEDAFNSISQVLEINNRNAEYWFTLGNICVQLNMGQEGEKAYKTALRLEPEDADYWVGYADQLFDNGKIRLAMRTLLDAEEMFPEDALVAYRLAAYNFLAGTATEGAVHLKRALALEPDSVHDFFLSFNPKLMLMREIVETTKRSGL